jgi:FkbM family methyltransferase
VRILIVSGIWPPDVGGPASHGPQFARHLLQQGHTVSAVVSAAERLDAADVAVRVIRRDRPLALRMPAGALALAGAVRHADVVYATGIYHRVVAACRLAGVPVVLKLVHDPAYERAVHWDRTTLTLEAFQAQTDGDPVVRTLRAARDRALGAADEIVVPSEYLGELVRGWGLRPPVTVISNPASVVPSALSRDQVRDSLGMKGLTAVFAGRLVRQKNLPLAIEAMRDVPGLELVLVGDGPERPAIERTIQAAGVAERVRVLGAVSQQQACDWMRAADVTLLTSDWENFPHAVVESLSQGTPVIATAVGGVPEIVEHDRNGWLVTPGDRAALTAALRRFVADAAARRRLTAGAADTAASDAYRPERLLALTEAVLVRTVGAAARRRATGRVSPGGRAWQAVGSLRRAPGADCLLRAVRAPADRALIALGRPPFIVALEDSVLAGYLRHRGYLAQVASGYESLARELFVGALVPGATVVDGGAHIGLYTMTAARHIGPTGRVFAFEPDPYNAIALRRNIAANGLTNVDVQSRALTDAIGHGAYHVSSGTVGSSLVDKAYIHDSHEIAVQTTTVDHVLGARPPADLIMKLDVEGVEERALRGARRTLAASATAHILVEHNPAALRDGGSSGNSLVRLLRDLGLSAFFVDEARHRLVAIDPGAELDRKGNIWAVKG